MVAINAVLNSFYRWLPDFKGKQRIGRFIFKKLIANSKDILVIGKTGITYLLPNLKENIGYEIFINGVYEKENSDFIINSLPAGGSFIDIGANIGSIAIPVSKSNKGIKIICIEASKKVFKYLTDNCSINELTNISLVNRAVSDKENIKLNFYSPVDQFGKGHISADFKDEVEEVLSTRLDTILKDNDIKSPDLIKVDIEGYEYYAFKSAAQILEKADAPDILFEFEDWAEERAEGLKPGKAQEFLLHLGYKLYELKKGRLINSTFPKISGSAMIWATKK